MLDKYLLRKGQSVEVLIAGIRRDSEKNPGRHLEGAPQRHAT